MTWFSVFFFFSGLCSIIYELVWLRLAMAKFGVNTALVSIVLSVFMAGLGAGSWLAGAAMRRHGDRLKLSPLRLYGCVELLIGISALLVPLELAWGGRVLERMAGAISISSATYYLLSGAWLAMTLLPWCACMGVTIPVGMFIIRRHTRTESPRSFSLLYLANVIGAVAGACLAPMLIELYGFHATLHVAALINALIFVSAFAVTFTYRWQTSHDSSPESTQAPIAETPADNFALFLLFATGLATMGAEIVWIRLYTYFIDPVIYSFALILASYLAATFIGSKVYRVWSRRRPHTDTRLLWISLAFFGLVPLITADPRIKMNNDLRVILGVAPFAGVIGFLTPMLVDRWSAGDPDRAGRAYAVNVLGCIVGPLLAGFVLLPLLGERVSMLVLVLPWFAMTVRVRGDDRQILQLATVIILIAAVTAIFFARDYEAEYPESITLRDSTATVIATGQGQDKQLLVNGVGMTSLTPITKMMAHLTLSQLRHPPRNALIICFGMGTTFRSAMSWSIPVTVVELVPSVPRLFTYYHPDGGPLLTSPRARIVIDDGRRFLDRSSEKFDAIIIDPPPPIEAAGSSLLYSRDFYRLVRDHLTPGGILQQWIFGGDDADRAAATRALMDVFPHVTVYGSLWETQGIHYLSSMQPIPQRSARDLVARMPNAALADMMEWGPAKTPEEQFNIILSQPFSPQHLLALSPATPALQDDRPINEYYRLRSSFPRVVQAAN